MPKSAYFFFFKQKTAYELRISDWSSDGCSSVLLVSGETITAIAMTEPGTGLDLQSIRTTAKKDGNHYVVSGSKTYITNGQNADLILVVAKRSEEHTSELQSLMRNSYAVLCLI